MTSDMDNSDLSHTMKSASICLKPTELSVSLLTGGADRPYVFGLATSLMTRVDRLDLIGSEDLAFAEFQNHPRVTFLNLRGSHRSNVSFFKKVLRILAYYIRLICYAAVARPRIFHILWNNKFETFDRTLLMFYYRLLGKKIVLTLHNVNAGKRDQNDSWLNRLTLRIQYHLAEQIFVHTEKMRCELEDDFGIRSRQVSVIPFGINSAVPTTDLTSLDAKNLLGLSKSQKVILFFGNITPYKGIEYLVAAFRKICATRSDSYRLIIAGKPDRFLEYWAGIRESITKEVNDGRILLKDSFIAEEDVEVYFKAADVFVLPYKHVYQSGVLFLGQSFGLPVIAADVGSLKDEVTDGETGFVFRPEDPEDLAGALEKYFASDLYSNLQSRRIDIRNSVMEHHSWETVGRITTNVYGSILHAPRVETRCTPNGPIVSTSAKDKL